MILVIVNNYIANLSKVFDSAKRFAVFAEDYFYPAITAANHSVNHVNKPIRVTIRTPVKNWAGFSLAVVKSVLIIISCLVIE
jgi:hypothetical protein